MKVYDTLLDFVLEYQDIYLYVMSVLLVFVSYRIVRGLRIALSGDVYASQEVIHISEDLNTESRISDENLMKYWK